MKKLFSSILAVMVTLSAVATETAYVRMKLAGSNPTYSTSTIKLTEDDARTPAYESGYDSERMMEQSNDNSVLFYAYVGTQECANIATNNLDGLALCFNTNNIDQNYTITFELATGRSLTLYDRVENTSTAITAGDTYNFSVTLAQVGRVAITDRFFINLNSSDFNISVTTNDYGWASYSNDAALVATAPAGLKIYKGVFDGDATLTLAQVDHVAANQGVIVYGAPNTQYFFAAGTGSSDFSGNELKPSSAWTSNTGNIFVLHDEALYEYTGSDMPANKAFLDLGPAPAPKRISLRVDGTTAIDNVEAEAVKAEKVVENGQIFIRRGNEVYNLQGQLVK